MKFRRPRGFIVRDSLLLAFAGGGTTAFGATFAQAVATGQADTSLIGLCTTFGINGLLIFMLTNSLKREAEQAKAFAAELKELANRQTEQAEKLLTTVIGLIPPPDTKGRKDGR